MRSQNPLKPICQALAATFLMAASPALAQQEAAAQPASNAPSASAPTAANDVTRSCMRTETRRRGIIFGLFSNTRTTQTYDESCARANLVLELLEPRNGQVDPAMAALALNIRRESDDNFKQWFDRALQARGLTVENLEQQSTVCRRSVASDGRVGFTCTRAAPAALPTAVAPSTP